MIRARHLFVLPFSALVVLAIAGCKKKGTGDSIASGDDCRQGDPKSHCAAGLYCEPSTGRMEQEGDNFFIAGHCRTQKTVGAPCKGNDECAPPTTCGGGMCNAP